MEKHHAAVAGDSTTANALNHLSSWGMKIWNQEFKEASHYHLQLLIHDGCKKYSIQRMDNDAPQRIFDTNGRWNCNARVSFLFQCAHEICADGYSFVLSQVDKRWIKRVD